MEIFDTNHNVTSKLAQIKALGVKTIIRYLATGDKSIMQAEARAIAAAGLRLGLVYEAWGDTHGELGSTLGLGHARDTLAKAPVVGTPDGAAVYFAVDNDESAADLRNRIIPYFKAIKLAIGARYRIGVYGSGNVCAAVLDSGYGELAWLANARGWGGYQTFLASGRWSILQHLPQLVAGLDTDPDEINPARPDIGDFVPFNAMPMPAPAPSPTPAPVTLAQLQSALHVDIGPIDTPDKLAQITLAIRAFQKARAIGVDGVAGPQTLGLIA